MGRRKAGGRRATRARGRKLPSGLVGTAFARGASLFFGAFAVANAYVLLRGAPRTEDLWWIDLSWAPQPLAGAFVLVAATLLLAWGLAPAASRWRGRATAVASALLALTACRNVADFYGAWRGGSIAPALPVPASVLFALVFAWIAVRAWRGAARTPSRRIESLASVGVACALALLFPLVHVAFFGTTDYRRSADAAVVFGAKVYANGALSTTVEDRVRTGVDLYKAGLVSRLVMSGAVGKSGVDEPVAMRDRAVAMGVPAEAVLLDHAGENTDATVRETTGIFTRENIRGVLAVSQFYHLPRIKMAYRAAGWEVGTVPATFSRVIPETPWLVAREVPAFWSYWLRSVTGV